MNRKRLFKFYFDADGLNGYLDNLMSKYALASADWERGAEYFAEKIAVICTRKCELGELWAYADSVMTKLTEEERGALKLFGLSKEGFSRLPHETVKLIRRSAVKFTRSAHRLERFEEALRLVDYYYRAF